MNAHTSLRRTNTNGVNVLLGLWIIISPYVLGFIRNDVARWNDIATGIAVGILALSGGSWGNVILGLWLIISPWVLGFANAPTLLWNNVILGALVALMAFFSRSTRGPQYAATPPE